jgi:hypothetical protein
LLNDRVKKEEEFKKMGKKMPKIRQDKKTRMKVVAKEMYGDGIFKIQNKQSLQLIESRNERLKLEAEQRQIEEEEEEKEESNTNLK